MRIAMQLLFLAAALAQCVSAVTVYTTFLTDSNGQMIQPSNTNTAVGPAYTGFTGAFPSVQYAFFSFSTFYHDTWVMESL